MFQRYALSSHAPTCALLSYVVRRSTLVLELRYGQAVAVGIIIRRADHAAGREVRSFFVPISHKRKFVESTF